MSSIQERLQLKRVPLDTWNLREQLCLASAVVRSGDQNWMSVSRALKTVGDPNRPADWFSQKSCAAQYGALLEHVETPKRKKRSSEGAVETPQESILKRLTQERIAEIQKSVSELNQQHQALKAEIEEINKPETSEERLKELWNGIEVAKKAREREQAKRAAWLREREERRARADRPWRPTTSTPIANAAPPASPLLTSLLKSSPVVTTPQHITHPANVVETISPSAGAPTLSMLLDKQAAVSHDTKHAAIEHIKSQLVQIEQQLKDTENVSADKSTLFMLIDKETAAKEDAAIEQIKSQFAQIEQQLNASTTAPSPVTLVPPVTSVALSEPVPTVDKVDIDDIEIKAEDVYAFSDIDLEIPPVSTIHKTNVARVAEKSPFTKKEDEPATPIAPVADATEQPSEETSVSVPDSDISSDNLNQTVNDQNENGEQRTEDEGTETSDQEITIKIAFPEVKFPTAEIKVISSDIHENKEETKEVELNTEEAVEETHTDDVAVVQKIPTPSPEEKAPESSPPTLPDISPVPEEAGTGLLTGDIPLPPGEPADAQTTICTDDSLLTQEEIKQEIDNVDEKEEEQKGAEDTAASEHSDVELGEVTKKEEETEVEKQPEDEIEGTSSLTDGKESRDKTNDMAGDEPVDVKEEKPSEPDDTHTETDDDTPMELSREEEKDGKKKRDYSRKKKYDSRTWSGSESAPESPAASSDAERHHRLWKKSVMLVYSRLCAHKYASLFLRPITDEQAPGYSVTIKRPMDLSTIKRNIDGGNIRTTAEFQRDILLMLSNALMYNSSNHHVYEMAKEMHLEAEAQLGMLLQAQAHAGLSAASERRASQKRRANTAPQGQNKRRHD